MPDLHDDFLLDGDRASDLGIRFQREIEFEGAEPNVEAISVPGRNGDILYFDGSYKNVKGLADCFCLRPDAARVTTAINAWLLKSTEYRKLETKSEPDYFRMARIVRAGKINPRLGYLNPFELEFDCKPQKYLKDGMMPIDFSANSVLINTFPFPAKPLIYISGTSASGTVTVGGETISLSDCDNVVVDCETLRAYKQSGITPTSLITLTSGNFPVLNPGTNNVQFTGAVSKLTIIPRWWTI